MGEIKNRRARAEAALDSPEKVDYSAEISASFFAQDLMDTHDDLVFDALTRELPASAAR